MRGKYIVKTQGEIVQIQDQSYAVVAHNKNEAIEKAKSMFLEEYPVIENASFHAQTFKVSLPLVLGMFLIFVAVGLSFFRWRNGHNMISIGPTLISVIYSSIIYSAFFVRFKGIHNMFKSFSDYIYTPLMILLLSSFIQILMSSSTVKFLMWELPIDAKTLLFFVAIMSWLGLKVMSVACTLLLLAISIGNIVSLDAAMGNTYGTIYALCSFLGLAFYAASDSAFYSGVKSFRGAVLHTASNFSEDFKYASSKAKEHGTTVVNTLKKKPNEED